MVEAVIDGVKVTYDSGAWTTKSESLMDVLPLYEECYWIVDGGYTPDRDVAIVQYVLEITGGKIVKFTPPDFDPKVVY
jgi:hypothetical protein